MVIDYLNVMGMPIAPDKTNAPLSIYANTVLTLAVARKRFEPIAWRNTQILQCADGIENQELLPGLTFKSGKRPNETIFKQGFRVLIGKVSDHGKWLYQKWYSVKQNTLLCQKSLIPP